LAQRNFSNNAVETQLVVPVDDTAGTFVVSSTTGWPVVPFSILIDPDQPEEESCLVTFISGSTLTVTRGYDGTVALPHGSGAAVKHAATAADFREANLHVNAVDAVHGVLGDIVGTSDVQTLTNKAISGSNNTITDIPQSAVTGLDDSLALKADLAGPTFTGTVTLPATTSVGPVSATEIGHLDGAASNIQAQIDTLDTELDLKAPINSPTFTGTVSLPSSTTIGTVSAGEIATLDGVTSNIQSQINTLAGASLSVLPTGGSTGQVLTKRSSADFDVEWQTLTIVGNGVAADAIYPENAFSGGTKTTYTDPISGYVYEVRTFNYTTGFTTSVTNSTGVIGKLLVAAGGGGGGNDSGTRGGGGGGSGGVWFGDYAFGAGQHNLLVGAGGAGSTDGQNSTFDDIIVYGGGKGGNANGGNGSNGGSGGGGAGASGAGGTGTQGTGAGSGFFGSNGAPGDGNQIGGTGGSANVVTDITGTTLTYGVGAAGGGNNTGTGGNGANRGNGGGGSGTNGAGGGTGGNGVIIIRYRIA
jgi:hypothetical protein